MKPLAVIVIVVVIISVATVRADEFGTADNFLPGGLAQFLQSQRISGTGRTNYFYSSKNLDDDTDFFGATAQIKVLPELTAMIDGKVEARITHSPSGENSDTQSDFLEMYVTSHFATADLRVGKQIVAWGRADGINPTDNLTPRDFVVLLPNEEDQRFGTFAVKLDVYLSPIHSFTVFMTPFFEPSEISLPMTGGAIIKKTPARTLSNSEFGLKLDMIDEGFDGSISFFRGFSLLPGMRDLVSDAAGTILELHYDPINVLGADFARNFGRFGIRGEAAYVDTTDDAGTDPGVKNSYLFWIAGIDRTFFENLNINLQFFQRRIRRFHNPESIADPLERSIAIQNSVIDGQRDPISNGFSLRTSNKWFNDAFIAEIFAVANFARHDRFVRPILTYSFSDRWKGTAGAELYSGADDTQFGSLKRNRSVFAELRYDF